MKENFDPLTVMLSKWENAGEKLGPDFSRGGTPVGR